MPVLCDELVKLPDTITEEEINRAKARVRASLLMRAENISSHAESNALDLIVHHRIRSKEERIERVNQITKEDLARVAKTILAGKPTLSALGQIQHVMPYEEVINRLK